MFLKIFLKLPPHFDTNLRLPTQYICVHIMVEHYKLIYYPAISIFQLYRSI